MFNSHFLNNLKTSRNESKTGTMVQQEIAPFVKRALLKELEELNQPRENVLFLDLCNKNPALFGESGSAQRRKIQIFFVISSAGQFEAIVIS